MHVFVLLQDVDVNFTRYLAFVSTFSISYIWCTTSGSTGCDIVYSVVEDLADDLVDDIYVVLDALPGALGLLEVPYELSQWASAKSSILSQHVTIECPV